MPCRNLPLLGKETMEVFGKETDLPGPLQKFGNKRLSVRIYMLRTNIARKRLESPKCEFRWTKHFPWVSRKKSGPRMPVHCRSLETNDCPCAYTCWGLILREKIGIAEVRVQQKGPFFPWVSRNKSGLRAGLQSNPLLTGAKIGNKHNSIHLLM